MKDNPHHCCLAKRTNEFVYRPSTPQTVLTTKAKAWTATALTASSITQLTLAQGVEMKRPLLALIHLNKLKQLPAIKKKQNNVLYINSHCQWKAYHFKNVGLTVP